jgi:hypothetical protein
MEMVHSKYAVSTDHELSSYMQSDTISLFSRVSSAMSILRKSGQGWHIIYFLIRRPKEGQGAVVVGACWAHVARAGTQD